MNKRTRIRTAAIAVGVLFGLATGIGGKNFPFQYDGYRRTADQERTRYGGSEAMPRTPNRSTAEESANST
jgi:hypothetical protein